MLALLALNLSLWQPPPERPANQARHAPKPKTGRNMFLGEKEQWLSETVAQLSRPYLVEYKDPGTAAYIQQLGQYLVDHSTKHDRPFHFVLTASREPNAESVGGGTVFVNLGLLRIVDSEDELACLMAHEVGHDEFEHLPKTVTRLFRWLAHIKRVDSPQDVQRGLSKVEEFYKNNPAAEFFESLSGIRRADELQADRAAFYTTFRAGYNPSACVVGLKKLDPGNAQLFDFLLSSHPPASQRTALLKWESNFVKLPDSAQRYASPTFDEMKKRLQVPSNYR